MRCLTTCYPLESALGSRPRVVGKRTPRFPVSYSFENGNGEKYFSTTRQAPKFKFDANDDEVAHEMLIVLAEASQTGGSPQLSRKPKRMVMTWPNLMVYVSFFCCAP